MLGNGLPDMLQTLSFLLLLHQIHKENELPYQSQISNVEIGIWKLSESELCFHSSLILQMDQQGVYPMALGSFLVDVAFEEAKHQFLEF